MSLAKDLWDMMSGDPDMDYGLPDEQKVLDRIEKELRKSIGDQEYDNLDWYVTKHKGDDDLHDLVEEVLEETIIDKVSNFDIFDLDGLDEDTIEDFFVNLNHDAIKNLYDRLEKSGYDAGKALNP